MGKEFGDQASGAAPWLQDATAGVEVPSLGCCSRLGCATPAAVLPVPPKHFDCHRHKNLCIFLRSDFPSGGTEPLLSCRTQLLPATCVSGGFFRGSADGARDAPGLPAPCPAAGLPKSAPPRGQGSPPRPAGAGQLPPHPQALPPGLEQTRAAGSPARPRRIPFTPRHLFRFFCSRCSLPRRPRGHLARREKPQLQKNARAASTQHTHTHSTHTQHTQHKNTAPGRAARTAGLHAP